MQLIDNPNIKYSLTTRAVPLDEMARVTPMYAPPRIGDLVLAEVQDLSQHKIPDARWGVHRGYLGHLFQGDGLGGEAILYVWVVD